MPGCGGCALHLHKKGDGNINLLQSKFSDQLLVHAKAIQEMRHFANILVLSLKARNRFLTCFLHNFVIPTSSSSFSTPTLSILCAPKLLCRKVKVQLIVSSPKIAFSPLASKFKSFCQKRVWCKALASYSQMNTKRKEQKKPQFFFCLQPQKTIQNRKKIKEIKVPTSKSLIILLVSELLGSI